MNKIDNSLNTAIADRLLESTLESPKAKDPRTRTALENIAKSCKMLLNENIRLTYVAVGERCKKEFNKPALGTINNDKNGFYKPLIDEYALLSKEADTEEPDEKEDFDELPLNVKVYINHLENRNKMLENITKVKASEIKGGGIFSITKTLEGNPNEKGHINPVLASGITDEQQAILSKLLSLENIEFVGDGAKRRCINGNTKAIIIQPSELRLLGSLVSDHKAD